MINTIWIPIHLAAGAAMAGAENASGGSMFEHFVVAGGWITWFLLIPLSLTTMALAVNYAMTIRRKLQIPPSLVQSLVQSARDGEQKRIAELTQADDTMLGQAAYAGVSRLGAGADAAIASVDDAVEAQAGRLMRRIEYLSVIGNIAPMIGLLGTVVGMIQAFKRIYTAGGGVPETSKLVGDIAIALVNTFWGLAIAIPALTLYALFRNRIDAFAADCMKLCGSMVISLSEASRRGGSK